MRTLTLTLLLSLLTAPFLTAMGQAPRPDYWQQEVAYDMAITMNAAEHTFEGRQTLIYQNNSPDTLRRVFYHLYFNAFQPGSMMDVRSRTIEDPDERVGSRIAQLEPDEQGYHRIQSLQQNGQALSYEVAGTVLEAKLAEPLPPGEQTTFRMTFNSQVPLQIRRSGRDNKEGVALSMSQWYPKMAAYDRHGWHADPYVAREFHGEFGKFEVSITIDSSYVVGGTGIVQNPQEVGHGYQDPEEPLERPASGKLTWQFEADSVHDFMWAADPDYRHDTTKVPNGPVVHFLYQPYTPDTIAPVWERLQSNVVELFQYMNTHFGEYPYQQYAVIQGGDGGMEYPMATLITGDRGPRGLTGVTAHEMAHSWFYATLATNENMHAWMDEGMTVYSSVKAMNHLYDRNRQNALAGSYGGYFQLANKPREEPMSLHADFYHTNAAYGIAAYSKGATFLHQMSYIVGKEAFMEGMRDYYRQWQFKHPYPIDFKTVMERSTGVQLDWYFNLFLNTTRTIDYGIKQVSTTPETTTVTLENHGKIPMPLDVQVTFANGDKQLYYIPLRMMRAEKPNNYDMPRTTLADWPWTHPSYQFSIGTADRNVEAVRIDPSKRVADVRRSNNQWPTDSSKQIKGN
jgi:hypothetical protein